MAVVITLSSGSDSDSDVEVVGFYSNRNQTLPLTTVQINVDLTNPSWAPADLDIYSRLVPSPQAVVDLTEYNKRREDRGDLFHLPSNGTDKGCASAAFQQNIFPKELRVCNPPPPVGTFTVQPSFTGSTDCSLASTFHTDEKTVTQSEGLGVTELPESLCDNRMSMSHSLPPESAPSISTTIYSDKEYYQFDYSPVSFSGEESTDYHTSNFEAGLDNDSTSPAQDDKYYVCPAAVKRLMRGVDVLTEVSMENQQMLGPLSLSLVYSTIEEGYTEGTLQLLSDLLQPDVYPPKDITHHLLKEILLCPQSPHHHCARAFSLLMRIQRHHIVDTLSVSWDWEMLSNAIENEELCPERLHMFLDYVVRTLEDDLKTKQSTSAHHQSIVKALLSFNQQFPRIKDICKWLFSAIVKSTESHDIKDDHSRMVDLFQKMLSLALEADGSPTISSVKLSHELFHIVINKVQLRPQRMLLLESLQSKRLRCKLLEHLLDYSCPVKTSVPMSLSLLLHFLKNCTLSPDPFDGTEKWRRWEELIHHLWMLLLSYTNTVKEYTSGCKTENKVRVDTQIHKPEDVLSKRAVREAVEAFLSRSQNDVVGPLPLHVEESLTYLQDHLMDVCQR